MRTAPRTKRRLPALVALLALSLLAAACGGDDSDTAASASTEATGGATASTAGATTTTKAEPDKLVVQLSYVKDIQSYAYVYAEAEGIYDKYGLDVEVNARTEGVDPLQMVAAGQADIGFSDPSAVLQASAKGIDVVAIGVRLQRAPTSLTCRADSGATQLSDVVTKGLKVGLKTGVDPIWQGLLLRNGLDPAQAVTQPIATTSIAEIISGATDCMFTTFSFNEPNQIRKAGVDVVVFRNADNNYVTQSVSYVVKPETLAEKPEVLARWLKANQEAWQTLIDDPEAAARWIVDAGTAPGVVLEQQTNVAKGYAEMLESPLTDEKGLLYPDIPIWRTQAEILVQSGQLQELPDVDEVVTTEIADLAATLSKR